METFFVYQQGKDGLQAVKEQIEDFLTDIKNICSPTLFDEIKLGLTSINNQIGSVTVKKPKIRIVITPRDKGPMTSQIVLGGGERIRDGVGVDHVGPLRPLLKGS